MVYIQYVPSRQFLTLGFSVHSLVSMSFCHTSSSQLVWVLGKYESMVENWDQLTHKCQCKYQSKVCELTSGMSRVADYSIRIQQTKVIHLHQPIFIHRHMVLMI